MNNIDNSYFYADDKMCRIKPSLYIKIISEPFRVSNFKNTASYRQFLDGTFNYPMINMYDYSFNGNMIIIENIIHVSNDPDDVKQIFEKFFARYIKMENNPIDNMTGKEHDSWRKDVIVAECNHSFIKQHPKYPYDDRYSAVDIINNGNPIPMALLDDVFLLSLLIIVRVY